MAKLQDPEPTVQRGRIMGWVHARFIQPMLTLQTSVHSVSLGVSLGLFVGLTPTVGVQMVVVFIAGTLIKANRLVACAWVWISNPLTMIPMYYGYYWLGCRILSVDLLGYRDFAVRFASFGRDGFIEGLRELWDLGLELFEPLVIGSVILATLAAVAAYPVAFVLLTRHFRRRAEARLGMRSHDDP